MSQFVDKDQQIEEREHFENNKDEFYDLHKLTDRAAEMTTPPNIAGSGPLAIVEFCSLPATKQARSESSEAL